MTMDQLRRVLGLIGSQLGRLTPTQKLLVGSLCVIVLMSLFLVSQYAGRQRMVELIPTGTPEDQAKAADYLESAGIPYEFGAGRKVLVPAERKYPTLARLAKAQALPGAAIIDRNSVIERKSWLDPKSVQDQIYLTAVCNELGQVIRNFPGIERADVFIAAPEVSALGAPAKKPVATVTVFPVAGSRLDQGTVDALADLVAGTTTGLDPRSVNIIDGVNRRSYRAGSANEFTASAYMEQVAVVEERVRDKIVEHLGRFIGGVVVSVNAIVDGSRTETRTEKALPKGQGTTSVPVEEETTSTTSTSGSRAAAPGLSSNAPMDIEYAGAGSGGSTSDETSKVRSEVKIGTEVTHKQMPRGRPTKINVSVSVPRDYVAEVLRQRKAAGGAAGAAAPEVTESEIEAEWSGRVARDLEKMIGPLVQTTDLSGTALEAGEVVVSLIPIALASVGPNGLRGGAGPGAAGVGGGGGLLDGVSSLAASGLLKQVLLGALAVLSIGMMFVLVRKAGKAAPMPTAEELVGIPPALQPDSDLVGEADEGETAMLGIEIDSEELKRKKMLEEVAELIKANPQVAVGVFNRWLTPEN
jgi:flagellar biosynthesis/type III secretory pathway M-ring protein FliF/YscJ